MTRAVLFDWFNTLARYSPPREELLSQTFREFGIEVSPQKIIPGLIIADKEISDEIAEKPLRDRSPEDQERIFSRYQQTVLTRAGISFPETGTLARIMKRLLEVYNRTEFVLYGDAVPAIKYLKKQKLILCLLSNLEIDMKPVLRKLGIGDYIDHIVTAGEVGADKPQPIMFLTAMERTGTKASETIHVGDHYKLDAEGAMRVGIKPILIDRYDLFPEVSDCPRIHSLSELPKYL